MKAHQSAYIVVVSWTGDLTAAAQNGEWFFSLYDLPTPLYGDYLWQTFLAVLSTARYDFRMGTDGRAGLVARETLAVGTRIRGSFAYVAALP